MRTITAPTIQTTQENKRCKSKIYTESTMIKAKVGIATVGAHVCVSSRLKVNVTVLHGVYWVVVEDLLLHEEKRGSLYNN